jgi:hypothetical protein
VIRLVPTDLGKGHTGFTGGREQAQLDRFHIVEQRLVDVELLLFCVLHQAFTK